jgi:hypothetical protein
MRLNKISCLSAPLAKRFIGLLFLLIFFLASASAQVSFWGVDITGFDTATSSPKLIMLKSNPYFSHVRIQYDMRCLGTFVFGGNRMKEETPQRLEAAKYAKDLAALISAQLGETIPVSREMGGNCSGVVDNFFVWKKQVKDGKWITAYMLPGNKGYVFQTFLHATERNANEFIFYVFMPKAGGINNCIDAATKLKFHLE